MKKFLILGCSLFSVVILMGQSLDEAKKLLFHEKYNSAENLLHTILKNDASDAGAWYLLTEAYVHQNKVAKIEDSLKLAPAVVKNDPLFNVALGFVLLQKNSITKGWSYFDDAIKATKGKNPDVLLAIAKANVIADAGDASKAIELLNKAIKKTKHKEEFYTAIGDAWMKLHNASEAYQAYQIAIRENDQFAVPMYKLGMIFASQKNPDMYLKFFNRAIETDPQFAPAYYRLYFHYYFRNVNAAMEYLQKYIATADHSLKMDYDKTDLLYLTKKYNEAILDGKKLIQEEKNKVQPRIYKLIAYSYKESGDTMNALPFMKKYFEKAPDSMYVVKDFATMADIYSASIGQIDSAVYYYTKAAGMEKDTANLVAYYKNLADIASKQKKYSSQAKWLGKYYKTSSKVTNVDLFNFGIAHYLAKEYNKADSVFALYSEKYPEQNFGYYWRARSNGAIDTSMTLGLAVPHYQKLIELFEKDSSKKATRKILMEAYGYLAAYESNTKKDYREAITYFEKLLTLDPGNTDAKKYVDILKENLSKEDTVTGS